MSTELEGKSLSATLWRERDEPAWMTALRKRAFEDFSRRSWPTPEDEEWRRTDITALDLDKYRIPGDGLAPSRAEGSAGTPEEASGVIRFSGGACAFSSLDPELAAKGVRLISLAEAIGERNATIESAFAEAIARSANRFESWHYSQWSHGAFLYVPRFVEIARPFFVDFVESGSEAYSAPHMIVALEAGARATLIERLTSGDEGELLCNDGSDVRLGEGAALQYVRFQGINFKSRYFNNSQASVGRDATFRHFEVAFGSRLHKSRYECAIDGPGSDTHLDGVYFAHKRQHFDIGTIQKHNAPNANSRALYKGAVRDAARTVYQGLIEVGRNASKTDAFLTNKNLIMNDGARSDSIPMLRINTNDVKCSHGSTTGKLDELERFYLMSRGFPRVEADKLLIMGFFEDVIAEAHEAIREQLRQSILERLD